MLQSRKLCGKDVCKQICVRNKWRKHNNVRNYEQFPSLSNQQLSIAVGALQRHIRYFDCSFGLSLGSNRVYNKAKQIGRTVFRSRLPGDTRQNCDLRGQSRWHTCQIRTRRKLSNVRFNYIRFLANQEKVGFLEVIHYHNKLLGGRCGSKRFKGHRHERENRLGLIQF